MLLLLSLLLAANLTEAHASPTDEIAKKIARTFNPNITTVKKEAGWSFYGCRIEDLEIMGSDPVTNLPRKIEVKLYHAKPRLETKASVIILPPTGGVNILDRGYANELCSSGLNAALVVQWEHQNETSLDFEMHNKGALRALAATRHVVEFLQQESQNFIGLLGTSVGAIAGSLVLGFEPRIAATVLITGSARFADVIAYSDEEGATKLREQRMQLLNLRSMEDYQKAVKESVYVEPANFLGMSGKKKTFIISADRDTTVPTQYQYELADRIQAEKHLKLEGDHVGVIKDTFFYYRKEVVHFFHSAKK